MRVIRARSDRAFAQLLLAAEALRAQHLATDQAHGRVARVVPDVVRAGVVRNTIDQLAVVIRQVYQLTYDGFGTEQRTGKQLHLSCLPHALNLRHVAIGHPTEKGIRGARRVEEAQWVRLNAEVRDHEREIVLYIIITLRQLNVCDTVEEQTAAAEQCLAAKANVAQQTGSQLTLPGSALPFFLRLLLLFSWRGIGTIGGSRIVVQIVLAIQCR
uniref:Putative secreted protein n=1 Tax=Anopheles triannulatus TaxID=58253 RepID=A0A2M4B2U3_9DIPT